MLKTDQDHDGTIDEAEFTALLSSIGASSANESLDVQQAERNIQAKDLLAEAGLPAPLESWYVALSANGYALDRADGHELGKSPCAVLFVSVDGS